MDLRDLGALVRGGACPLNVLKQWAKSKGGGVEAGLVGPIAESKVAVLAAKDREIERLKAVIARKTSAIAQKDTILAQKDKILAQKEKKLARLRATAIEWVPDELLCSILSLLDAKTLMIAVPQVCKLWRNTCQELAGVELDFNWRLPQGVPLLVLAGWPVLPVLQNAQTESQWASGMCQLFPRSTSVTLGHHPGVTDAHVLSLAGSCTGLTDADFRRCENLTDAALLALADKCRRLEDVIFDNCENVKGAFIKSFRQKIPNCEYSF